MYGQAQFQLKCCMLNSSQGRVNGKSEPHLTAGHESWHEHPVVDLLLVMKATVVDLLLVMKATVGRQATLCVVDPVSFTAPVLHLLCTQTTMTIYGLKIYPV